MSLGTVIAPPVRIALALAAIAVGCGGASDQSGPGRAPAPPAWGLPGGRAPEEPVDADGAAAPQHIDAEACDLVLVIVIDGVTREELSLYGADAPTTPRIDAIASGAAVYTDAVAVSTGGNAGLASILTGRHSREHGVASLRDLGRTSLSPDERTLAEAFHELDWSTVASLSEPRQARGFAGFAQGFDTFEAPRLHEAPRPPDAVALGARQALEVAFVPGRRVFALMSFGDLGARRRGLPPAARAAPFVEARLRPFCERRADIATQLERFTHDPEAALAELSVLLGRARGSEIARAWQQSLRDARLGEIDAAVGTVLDVIETAGRAETATVLVVAPRGRAPLSAEARVGARFVPSLLDVPLIVRWPQGARHGRVSGITSVIDAPRALAEVFGLELAASRFGTRDLLGTPPRHATAFVADAPLANFVGVRARGQIERYGLLPEPSIFPRSGDQDDDAAVDPASVWPKGDPGRATFRSFSAPAGLTVERSAAAPGVTVRWHSWGSRVVVQGAEHDTSTRRERGQLTSGSARLPVGLARGPAATLELALEKRARALWLDLDAGDRPLPPHAVAIGSALLSDLPVLFIPSPSGQSIPAGEAALVRFSRAEGVWWKLAVGGEGPVEMLVGTWPPRSPDDTLEVVAGGPVLRYDVPGREDLARLVGEAPFDVRIKKSGKEKFAIACRHAERFVRPEEIVADDRRHGTTSAFSILVPSWQPEISDALGDVTGALYATDALTAPIVVRRSGIGPVRGTGAALDLPALQFLKTLAPGE